MQHTTIIGIDPGQSGGIAIHRLGNPIEAHKMPATDLDLFDLIDGQTPETRVLCYVEKVGPTPQMGRSSAFKFGKGYGAISMACVAAGVRVEFVTPQKWQKALGMKSVGGKIGTNDTAKKNRNKAKAQELFPEIKITHAIADALLIAEYGRRQAASPP